MSPFTPGGACQPSFGFGAATDENTRNCAFMVASAPLTLMRWSVVMWCWYVRSGRGGNGFAGELVLLRAGPAEEPDHPVIGEQLGLGCGGACMRHFSIGRAQAR